MEDLPAVGTAADPENRAVVEGRSARKRSAILRAATELFLHKGYQRTSMDEVADIAAVSKQTVYKNFADKERLFTEVVFGVTDLVTEFSEAVTQLASTDNLDEDIRSLARRYVTTVIQPRVLQLRRLVIAEAVTFPELARIYHQRAPESTINALAVCFRTLNERGLLHVNDAQFAANHFAWLILAALLDRAMFYGADEPFDIDDLNHHADEGVRVFLAAYAPLSERR